MAIRSSDIVRALHAHPNGMQLVDLASELAVSERTIQRHITRTNEELSDLAHIERLNQGGYRLVIEDGEAFSRYLDGHATSPAMPESPDERMYYLLNDLCMREDWVTLDTLAGALFVSRRTVSNDLREVEKRLASFRLTLESKPYRGIRVTGTELDKRLCLASTPLITDGVWNVVAGMLDAVYQAYRFDFRNDLELRMNLARHVAPLLVRLSYGLSVDNPLTEDIRMRFPLAWSMAVDASQALQQMSGATVDMAETGYIALAFALAIERAGSSPSKKNILVVCASGAGSARLLEYRFKQQFGRYLNEVLTCDIAAVASCDWSAIDYVFTTVPLEAEIPVPVCQISAFLDANDAGYVLEMLQAPAASCLLPYFSPELFWPHVEGSSKDEVLTKMLDAVGVVKGMGDEFKASVRERERIAPTAFGNLVAMPHPVRACSDEPFVAVSLLDERIMWNAYEVQAVFLISFSDSIVDPDSFNAGMATLLTNADAIAELLRTRTFETLQAILLGRIAAPEGNTLR